MRYVGSKIHFVTVWNTFVVPYHVLCCTLEEHHKHTAPITVDPQGGITLDYLWKIGGAVSAAHVVPAEEQLTWSVRTVTMHCYSAKYCILPRMNGNDTIQPLHDHRRWWVDDCVWSRIGRIRPSTSWDTRCFQSQAEACQVLERLYDFMTVSSPTCRSYILLMNGALPGKNRIHQLLAYLKIVSFATSWLRHGHRNLGIDRWKIYQS